MWAKKENKMHELICLRMKRDLVAKDNLCKSVAKKTLTLLCPICISFMFDFVMSWAWRALIVDNWYHFNINLTFFFCTYNEAIVLKTVCSTDMLSDMQLFSRGWEFSSQSVPWKEVEVRMYALSMVSLYHLVKIANYCHKMQITFESHGWY